MEEVSDPSLNAEIEPVTESIEGSRTDEGLSDGPLKDLESSTQTLEQLCGTGVPAAELRVQPNILNIASSSCCFSPSTLSDVLKHLISVQEENILRMKSGVLPANYIILNRCRGLLADTLASVVIGKEVRVPLPPYNTTTEGIIGLVGQYLHAHLIGNIKDRNSFRDRIYLTAANEVIDNYRLSKKIKYPSATELGARALSANPEKISHQVC